MNQTESQWEQIRINRAVKLKETDWTQMSDAPLSDEDKAKFAVYRQALRDIPQSTNDPDVVVWPVKPE